MTSMYKGTFFRCFEEGYDAMSDYLNKKTTEDPICPYDWLTQHYENQAWETGSVWYMVHVH